MHSPLFNYSVYGCRVKLTLPLLKPFYLSLFYLITVSQRPWAMILTLLKAAQGKKVLPIVFKPVATPSFSKKLLTLPLLNVNFPRL